MGRLKICLTGIIVEAGILKQKYDTAGFSDWQCIS